MKLIDRYEFTNGKAFETEFLSLEDTQRLRVPECDVIAFSQVDQHGMSTCTVMRPDEALIQARMLIDAVRVVTEGYTVSAGAVDEVAAAER